MPVVQIMGLRSLVMKNRRNILKVGHAISELISAEWQLGRLRITEDLSAKEFLELCDIKQRIESIRKELQAKIKNGGEK